MQLSSAAAGYWPEALAFLFSQIVTIFPFALSKALVSFLHHLDCLLWRQLIALRPGESIGACLIRNWEAAAAHADHGRCTRHPKKFPAIKAIAIPGV
jgi:hypothetical protein